MRALNRRVERAFNPDRKEHHWAGGSWRGTDDQSGSAIAREQMTRFSTYILAVVMVSGGVSSAFAQPQPRYIVSPFAPFFNYGGRGSGPIPRTVVSFQSNYKPGTIYIDTSERRLYL